MGRRILPNLKVYLFKNRREELELMKKLRRSIAVLLTALMTVLPVLQVLPAMTVLADTQDVVYHLKSSAANGNAHFDTEASDSNKYPAFVRSGDADKITNESFEVTVIPQADASATRFGFVNKFVDSQNWSYIGYDASGWYIQWGNGSSYSPLGALGAGPAKGQEMTLKGEWKDGVLNLSVNDKTAMVDSNVSQKFIDLSSQEGSFGFRAGTYGNQFTDVNLKNIKINGQPYTGEFVEQYPGEIWEQVTEPEPTPTPTVTPTPEPTPGPEPTDGTKWFFLTPGNNNGGGHEYSNAGVKAPAVLLDQDADTAPGATMKLDFKEFGENPNFGIFYSYMDDNNWLYVGFDPSSHWYVQYNVNGSGDYPKLDDLPTPEPGKTMEISISLDRETLSVTVDGVNVKKNIQALINLSDTIGTNGKFGVKANGNGGKISFAHLTYNGVDCMNDNWDLLVKRGGEDYGVQYTKRVPVSGRITDADGNPIEDAIVRIGLDMVKTDSSGNYRFEKIETGDYTIAITKMNYIPIMKPFKVELEELTGCDYSLSLKSEINYDDYLVISSADMDVYVAKDYPRVLEYRMKDGSDSMFRGQEEELHEVAINGQSIVVSGVTYDKKDSEITYTLPIKQGSIDLTMDVKVSLDGNNLIWQVTKIDKKDGCPKISTIDFPKLNIVTLMAGEEGVSFDGAGKSTLTTDRVDKKITFEDGFIPGETKGYLYGFVSKSDLSAGLWSNSEIEGDARVYCVNGADTMSLKSAPWYYETGDQGGTKRTELEYPKSDLPCLKVCLTGERNNDGKVDWQDGAIAYRKIMNIPQGSEAIKDLVNYRIVMNFESEASNPYMKTADNVRKVYLATDGLGQALLLKGYGNEGHDSANSEYADISTREGGVEDFQELIRIAHQYNTEVGIHVNAQEVYPEAKSFNENMLAKPFGGGWGWLDQSLVIDKLWDLSTQARYKRFVQLYDRINGTSFYSKAWPEAVGDSTGTVAGKEEVKEDAENRPDNMDFIYLDVWYQNSWETRQIAKEVNALGWRFSTEFSDQGEYDSTWQHWSTDTKYGGEGAKGLNSDIIRFLRNDQRDSQVLNWPAYGGTADNPLLGGFRLAGFEGWGGQQNFDDYIQTTFNENIPTRFLQHYQVTNLVTYEDLGKESPVGNHEYQFKLENEDGDKVVVTRNEKQRSDINIERTITLNGKKVLDDVKYLLPWTDTDTGEEKLYNYDLDGGTTTWELQDDWKSLGSVVMYELTDQGRVNPKTINVEGGSVTLTSEAGVPYVVVKGEQVKSLKDNYGDGSKISDPGFNAYVVGEKLDNKIWSGDIDAESVSVNAINSDQYLSMGSSDQDVAVTTKIRGLEKGKDYVAEVYVDNGSDAKAEIEVKTGDAVVSNYTMRSTAENTVSSDQHHGTKMQYILVSFTAESTEAEFTLKRAAGEGETKWDDLRVVQQTLSNWQEDGSFRQDFESVVQGLYPFVLGTAQKGGDSRTHLSERNGKYTQSGWHEKVLDDAIEGDWSLKHHENNDPRSKASGLIYRTIPQNFRFEPGKVYNVSFDYQAGTANNFGMVVGDGTSYDVVDYFEATAAPAAGQKSTTVHYDIQITGAESGQTFIGMYSKGATPDNVWGLCDFVLDNLVIQEDKDAVSVTAEDNKTELIIGQTVQLYATNSDGAKWESSDESVVTIGQDGIAKAMGEGTATITVTSKKGVTGTIDLTVKSYVDTVLNPTGVTANTEESGQENGLAENTIDKDSGTWWHSNYSTSPAFTVSEDNPAIITVDLGESKLINGFRFQQRSTKNNGIVNSYRYAVGNEFDGTTITDGTLSEIITTENTNGGDWVDQFIGEDGVSARYIQIQVTNGQGGFAAIAEIEAYQRMSAASPADFTKLDEQIARAEALDRTMYTAESLKAVDEVLKTLPTEEERGEYTVGEDQEKVDNFTRALKKALDELVVNTKLDALKVLVQTANTLLNSDEIGKVRPAKVQALRDALAEAENLIKENSEDDQAIAEAMKNLNNAIGDLPEIVNKDTLNDLIAAAEALNKNQYPASEWEKVETALEAARKTAANDDADESEVQKAFSDLSDAIENLHEVVPPVKTDKSALEDTLKKAKAVDQTKYTAQTVKTLQNAIKKAEELLKNDNATQEEIDKAKAELEDAMSKLVKKSSGKPSGDKTNPDKVKTGDDTNVLPIILVMLLCCGGIAVILIRKRRAGR